MVTVAESVLLKSDRLRLWLLSLVIIFSGIFIGLPVVNVLIAFGALIGLVLFSVRYRYPFMLLVCIMALAGCALIYGTAVAAIFGYLALLPGVIMGYKARTYSTPFSIILWGFLPFLVPLALIVVYYSQIISIIPLLISDMQATVQQGAMLMGVSSGQVQQMLEFVEKALPWFVRLLPGILFTMFLALVFFSYASASSAAASFGAVLPRMTPLYFWQAHDLWLVPTGLSLLFVLIGGHWLKIIGENALVFFIHFYAFYGLCVVDYYLREINIPIVIRLVVYLFIILVVVIVIPVLAVIGLADSRFDFRKLGLAANSSKN